MLVKNYRKLMKGVHSPRKIRNLRRMKTMMSFRNNEKTHEIRTSKKLKQLHNSIFT